jgi:ABC-type molybdate transport system substrate-binding protein
VAGIKVMSAGAVKSMVAALGAEFERESGKKLDLNFGTAGSLRERSPNRPLQSW